MSGTSGGYTSGIAGGMLRTRASRYRLMAMSVHVDTGLDALGQWQHDAPLVRRLDASASVDVFAQAGVSDHLHEGMMNVRAISIGRPGPWAGERTAYGRSALHGLGLAWSRRKGARLWRKVINQQCTHKLGQLLRQRLAHRTDAEGEPIRHGPDLLGESPEVCWGSPRRRRRHLRGRAPRMAMSLTHLFRQTLQRGRLPHGE